MVRFLELSKVRGECKNYTSFRLNETLLLKDEEYYSDFYIITSIVVAGGLPVFYISKSGNDLSLWVCYTPQLIVSSFIRVSELQVIYLLYCPAVYSLALDVFYITIGIITVAAGILIVFV